MDLYIHPQINVFWGRSYKNKQNYMEELIISESTYEKMEEWINDKYETKEFAYPQIFITVELAREFYNTFLSHLSDLKIIGIGLPDMLVDQFLEEEETLQKPAQQRDGIETLLMNKVLIEKEGSKKGYEILGFEFVKFHSYLCNGLEKDYKSHFNFALNENGYVNSLNEAQHLCDYTNGEDMDTEPVLWLPWAIFEYEK